MRPSRWGLAVVLTVIAASVCACGLVQSTQRVSIDNGTDVPLMVHVSKAWVGTFAPGATGETPLGGHGGPPYSIEILSPSGAVLGSWDVTIEDMELIDEDGEGISWDVVAPCGWIHLWIGAPNGHVSHPSPSYEPCP